MSVQKEFFKIKVAVLFGYNGKPFFGSQKIQDVTKPTAERELEQALYTSKMISDSNFDDLHKIGWGRGSRTDRGVHACVNMISCKVCLDKKYVREEATTAGENKTDFKKNVDWQRVIGDINANLHKEVRVFGLRLVTRGFDVRKSARSRKYEYLAPLCLFRTKDNQEKSMEEILDQINELTALFKGAHNYHNYTKGTKPHEKQNWRFIHEVRAETFHPTFITEAPKDPFLVFKLHGQSFLYHQIRKMIGIVSQTIQLGKDKEFILSSFTNEKMDLWLAPSDGLLLDRVDS